MPLPFSGQCVKVAITDGLLRCSEDLPFDCEVWCSVAGIGHLPVSLPVCFCKLRQEVTTCAVISPCHNFFATHRPLPDFE